MMKTIYRFVVIVSVFITSMNSLYAQWTQANGPYDGAIAALAVSGTNLYAGGSGGVFLSSNNGTSWTAVNTGLTNTIVHAIAVSGADIYAGTDGGVFLSTNNGANWTAVSTGMSNASIHTFAVSGTNLYAAGPDRGLWKRPLSEMVTLVESTPIDIPKQYSLGQNYPNPFNPSTTISFNLPSRSSVTLKIYDMLGKEIASLVNEELPPGAYSRTWNASGISSGVYFYHLKAGAFTETKRLILLR
jgi:hypothetical protein